MSWWEKLWWFLFIIFLISGYLIYRLGFYQRAKSQGVLASTSPTDSLSQTRILDSLYRYNDSLRIYLKNLETYRRMQNDCQAELKQSLQTIRSLK